MKLIDPRQIMSNRLPLFVFSDDMRCFFNWGIKRHTKGNWPHSLIMIRPGYFVSQGWTFKEVPVEEYMTDRHRLKFWKYEGMDADTKQRIIKAVQEDLNAPPFKKWYDPIGIFGHLFRQPWFQIPGLNYCHERNAKYSRLIPGYEKIIPKHPESLNQVFIAIEEMKTIGYYDGELARSIML